MRVDGRAAALVGTVLALGLASFLLRTPCLASPEAGGLAALLPGCHGDLEIMWYGRGLAAGHVPYLQPFLDPATGQPVTVEYPVLTGMLLWLFSLPGSFGVFVALCALTCTLCAAATAVLLARATGRRAWLWAAAPALLFYLTYNLDALPAATATAALCLVLGRDPLTISRSRLVGAAVLLGVGGALKLYPLLLVLPLALWLAFGRPGPGQASAGARWGRALLAAATAGTVFVAANLPFAVANPQGWWLPFSFQATRPTDLTTLSVWYLLGLAAPAVSQGQWMLASTVATGLGIVAAAALGWRAGRRTGSFPLAGTAVVALVAYLLANKVHSPQYILWLLPLLLLAGAARRGVVSYLVVDVVMFTAFGLGLYLQAVGVEAVSPALLGLYILLMYGAMVVRAGVLVKLATPLLRSDGAPGRSAASG